MSEDVTIGKRFTLVIPKKARLQLKLKEGQRVQVRVESGHLLLEPYPLDPYETLKSVIHEPYNEETDEANAEEWLKKHAGR
ncbi:MAG TPA: AbrB/MazE/SpoVT family DNA-binding domain-containing protein [Candidatus Lokiarchaeia archaeon]|nr:AbrB/MazE/SpoVT family DNA-binding domain-containing protein [Candidatus Lokiarchaeia archaeon]